MSAAEDTATASLVGEMIAEGLVEKDHEVIVRRENGRTFMVETRLLDVTNAEHGYTTLDCRAGQHAACAACDCSCHRR